MFKEFVAMARRNPVLTVACVLWALTFAILVNDVLTAAMARHDQQVRQQQIQADSSVPWSWSVPQSIPVPPIGTLQVEVTGGCNTKSGVVNFTIGGLTPAGPYSVTISDPTIAGYPDGDHGTADEYGRAQYAWSCYGGNMMLSGMHKFRFIDLLDGLSATVYVAAPATTAGHLVVTFGDGFCDANGNGGYTVVIDGLAPNTVYDVQTRPMGTPYTGRSGGFGGNADMRGHSTFWWTCSSIMGQILHIDSADAQIDVYPPMK